MYVRPWRIELQFSRWQRGVLPLNYGRIHFSLPEGTVFNTILGNWSIHNINFFLK